MKIHILDGKYMTSPASAHSYIADTLGFPAYYGKNLDALADCLGELGSNTAVVFINSRSAVSQLGAYGKKLVTVFKDISSEENSFELILYKG